MEECLPSHPDQCKIKACIASMVDFHPTKPANRVTGCVETAVINNYSPTDGQQYFKEVVMEIGRMECMEGAYTLMTFPPARLPWIPVLESNRRLFELFYDVAWQNNNKTLLVTSDLPIQICCSINMQRYNAKTFPYYLPQRYHAMDCLLLLEHSSGNKSLHIANASKLFTFNKIYGLHSWNAIVYLERSAIAKGKTKHGVNLMPSQYIRPKTQMELFADKGDLHLCESAAEFLLEPWLLMQVPWHPAVYYQWLTAALAEVLKAKKQLVEFYWWPVPKQLFQLVCKVLSLVETLHRRLICGFRLINWLTNFNEEADSGFETNCHTVECILNLVILPSLPIIEFLVGDKFNSVVRALKGMTWPSKGVLTTDEEELVASCCFVEEIDCFLPAFCLKTDDLGNATHMFGKIGTFEDIKDELAKLPCKIDLVSMESLYDLNHQSQRDDQLEHWENREKDIKLLKKIVSKRLKGEVVFTKSMWHAHSLKFADILKRINCSKYFLKGGVQLSDISVIYNIQYLKMMLVKAENEATCCAIAYSVQKKDGRKVHLCAPDSSGPEMSLEMVEKLLTDLDSKKWTLDTLKAKIPGKCKSAINCKESCPDIKAGYETVIKAFELRIKKLVYHIFDVSSTKGLEESFIFPEWQFIQYILPCFVSLFGQHATNPKTKPTELLAYTRFVHKLIQSFELKLTTKHVIGEPGNLTETKACDIPDFVWVNLANNVVLQLQEVESELGMLIYGTHKRMKKVDTSNVLLGQIGFRQLKETMRFTGHFNRKEETIFRCWGETLLHCVPRMREAIVTEMLLLPNPFPINNLLQALVILQELSNIADVCNKPEQQAIVHEILNLASQKVKLILGKQQHVSSKGNLEKKLYLEMQKLTVQQLLGSVLFILVLNWNEHMLKFLTATNMFRSALCNDAIDKYAAQDWRGLRCLLAPLLSDQEGNDLSLVTIDFAKKSMSIVYKLATLLIEENDPSRNMFRKLQPALPIKLCMCCGKFEGCEVKLRMCTVCVDNRDFPDVHWFCSNECEAKVLSDWHLEEHDHFLMVKLGLV